MLRVLVKKPATYNGAVSWVVGAQFNLSKIQTLLQPYHAGGLTLTQQWKKSDEAFQKSGCPCVGVAH